MVSKFVLPVGFAVVATGLLCTFVFGGVYAVSLLDDWLQQRAEKRAEAEGRTDVFALALGIGGVLTGVFAGRVIGNRLPVPPRRAVPLPPPSGRRWFRRGGAS